MLSACQLKADIWSRESVQLVLRNVANPMAATATAGNVSKIAESAQSSCTCYLQDTGKGSLTPSPPFSLPLQTALRPWTRLLSPSLSPSPTTLFVIARICKARYGPQSCVARRGLLSAHPILSWGCQDQPDRGQEGPMPEDRGDKSGLTRNGGGKNGRFSRSYVLFSVTCLMRHQGKCRILIPPCRMTPLSRGVGKTALSSAAGLSKSISIVQLSGVSCVLRKSNACSLDFIFVYIHRQ